MITALLLLVRFAQFCAYTVADASSLGNLAFGRACSLPSRRPYLTNVHVYPNIGCGPLACWQYSLTQSHDFASASSEAGVAALRGRRAHKSTVICFFIFRNEPFPASSILRNVSSLLKIENIAPVVVEGLLMDEEWPFIIQLRQIFMCRFWLSWRIISGRSSWEQLPNY